MNKAETLEELRIPEEGHVITLIAKLVAGWCSDDSPEVVDEHKETYNAAIDHVEELIERRIHEIDERLHLSDEPSTVSNHLEQRKAELERLVGDFSRKGDTTGS